MATIYGLCCNEKQKEYRESNKEELKQNANEIVECECGFKSTKSNLARHKKSMKHLNGIKRKELC